MVTKQRQTIRQRIKSRMKGLAALLLAVALAVGMMPAVEARADEPDNYYLIAFVSGYDGILCKGTETMTGIPANQTAFGPWNGDSTGTYYVNYSNGGLAVRDGSTFTEVGKIGSATPSQAVDLEVSEATNFYFGTTSGYQFYIEVKLDGTSKGTSTGSGNSGKASFTIPAGKYTVQLTSNVNKKWTVDINTAITSLTLSKTSLEFTVGDPEQQLTVQPDTAKVKWSSSNPNVASVDDSGKVTPVGVGNADITVALQTDENVKATCKVNVKAKEKPAATVDKAPTARTLTYIGSAQELVAAGEATGGEMQYAIGENATTVPTSGWSTSIPTATEAGTYYVWYKVIGDKNHNDTKPSCITVTIGKKTDPEITPDPQPQPPAPEEGTTQPQPPAPEKPANQKYKNKLRINAGLKFQQTGSKITGKWGKVTGANLYEVYGAYCNKKAKLIKTVKGYNKNKLTIKKLNGKKLSLKKNYKFYVVAYKKVNGKKTKLAKSLIVHIVGRKNTTNTNVKSIKLKKKSYTLKKGRTAKIKPRLVLMDKKKKALSKKHGPRFRYASSNKAVATVTKGGKIKARKAGKCTVYVYAINGCAKKIKVTVR